MNFFINNIFVLIIAFIGADRINLLSSNFEYFNLTPFILIAFFYIFFITIFCINDLNFNWLYKNDISFLFLLLMLIFILISVLVSQDYVYSIKRVLFLLFIFLTFVLSFSFFSKNNINYLIYQGSILGSLFFLIFNIAMVYLWLNFLEYENLFIDLIPNKISYYIPRLGGYSLDVNRGGVVLFFYTVFLFNYKKNFLSKIFIVINVITLFFTFSRTVYILVFFTLAYYMFMITSKEKTFKILKYLFSTSLFGIFILFYLDSVKLIELTSLLDERLNIDWELSRKTSSGIHLRLIYEGLQTALGNIKILLLGNGFGTSFLLIKGYYWSGTKYANYHSMYITLLVECGLFTFICSSFYTFIVPLFNKCKNIYMPLVFGLFFYNIFYQLLLEPIYWFIIFIYYYENYKAVENEI